MQEVSVICFHCSQQASFARGWAIRQINKYLEIAGYVITVYIIYVDAHECVVRDIIGGIYWEKIIHIDTMCRSRKILLLIITVA